MEVANINILEFKNVSMSFCNTTDNQELQVLDDINFTMKQGEIVAIVGPSGSGKTTILNLISKLIKPEQGEVDVNGEIGYMFQHDHLFEWRNIYNNVILGLEIKRTFNDNTKQKVEEMLKKYGLWEFKSRTPSELSGGMRQRVALIRTLAVDPDILLLDEPFAALDYQTKLTVCDDVYRIIKQENKTTIIVTHDISEAISIADRVIVLSKRPAKIKQICEIKLTLSKEKTPLHARSAPEFREYFDYLWRLMNE